MGNKSTEPVPVLHDKEGTIQEMAYTDEWSMITKSPSKTNLLPQVQYTIGGYNPSGEEMSAVCDCDSFGQDTVVSLQEHSQIDQQGDIRIQLIDNNYGNSSLTSQSAANNDTDPVLATLSPLIETSPSPIEEDTRPIAAVQVSPLTSSLPKSSNQLPLFKLTTGKWEGSKYKDDWFSTPQLGLIKMWAKQHWLAQPMKLTFRQMYPYLLQQYGQAIFSPQFQEPLEVMINNLNKTISNKRHFKYKGKIEEAHSRMENPSVKGDDMFVPSSKASKTQAHSDELMHTVCTEQEKQDQLLLLQRYNTRHAILDRTRLWQKAATTHPRHTQQHLS